MTLRLYLLLGGALACYVAGGWTVWQLWSVDSLTTQVDALKAERDLKQRQADAAARIAASSAKDAIAARDMARKKDAESRDLVNEFQARADEAAKETEDAKEALKACRSALYLSPSDRERLRKQIPIGGQNPGSGP